MPRQIYLFEMKIQKRVKTKHGKDRNICSKRRRRKNIYHSDCGGKRGIMIINIYIYI